MTTTWKPYPRQYNVSYAYVNSHGRLVSCVDYFLDHGDAIDHLDYVWDTYGVQAEIA